MEIQPPTNTTLTVPKVITFSKTIGEYKINNIGVVLGTSASIDVWFYDANNSFIGSKVFVMTGTEYTNWGVNDIPYVETWVETQINTLTTL